MTDNRVALMLVDYPGQARLKILGRAEILEGGDARAWIERVRDPRYKAVIERVFVIRVEEFDWNCPQHITPRFTEDQIQEALAPIEARMRDGDRSSVPGAVRVSLGIHNTEADVERLARALGEIAAGKYDRKYRLNRSTGEYEHPDWNPV